MKTRDKKHLRRNASSTVNGTVPPRLTLNRDRRPREYLTPKEIERLMERARKRGRYGLRDATMILVAYRHGLRPGELCALRWDQIDFAHALLHVRRLKNGIDSFIGMVRATRAETDEQLLQSWLKSLSAG
jgi:type 1 fimbriae regulatory protein FimB/type 1 fimbriae regulatory protein FimE